MTSLSYSSGRPTFGYLQNGVNFQRNIQHATRKVK
jgi:hypothetical protein